MSDIPLPQPLTDDEAAELDYLYENYEADHREGQWADALEWARKGDFAPLVECLRRTDFPLDHPDVRNWLADGLADRFKKPRRVKKRPKFAIFEDASGRRFYLDQRHLKIFEAMKLYAQLVPSLGEDAALKSAKGSMTSEELHQHLRRPRSRWALRPVKDDGMLERMFAGVPGVKP
ncbi:hypothetical protein FNL55_13185 [Tardiphaga sp. vice352]|uniref:hypothetical protein n=1 Tax=Tardiphaga sp. vice352 TaxID=2592816 RepID=UPI00116376BB|nr:hypothetical protein [Tardiphaga sp. vice352]QDM32185.1 hypothetical protein FNL55_13185 [Tardiphaga sp. vice352]